MPSLSDIPIIGKVTEDISSATIEGLKREFLYMYKYKDNVNDLNAKMEELGVQEEKIKRKIEIATDDGWIIEERVRKWQEDVKQIKDEEKVEEFLEMYKSKRSWRCLKVLRFPNLYSRFRTGREAVKKAEKMNGLTVRGEELVNREIGHPRRFVYADLPSDNDYVRFESRKDAYKKILEALNNNDAGFLVGIYGMAGAGKTRMMEQAWKQAKKDGIFDEVARADVGSEKLDVRKLQEQLASCLNLYLRSEENEEIRASLLANRLTGKGNKILVLFDDVWEELPLNKIGVPFGDDRRKGCKILLTSRDRGVCFKNNCENPIEIKVLKGEEGWGLFTKNVGSATINSLNDKSLAKKVCDECACLPLVIAAVGKALRGKPHDSWIDALGKLQDSKLEKIDGIDPKVYTCLESSLNHLQKDAKSCLFLCSVFPEDAVISIEELARLVKGNRLIEDVDTLEIARKRVRSSVVALKDSSLVLPYDDNKVKLHDIIRDVAKSVAAKDPTYAFLEKSCDTKWPDVDYKDRKLISLSFYNINYFPCEGDLACPELHTLVLNLKTAQFPDRFFNGFPKLRVLVLNGWSTFHLPSSLQSLTNLRMLSLYITDLNMSLIKELKNLEMLIILNDIIEELSLELRELKHLRLLDTSRNYCRNMIMPRHLLSSLSNLEELYIPRGFMSPRGKEEGGGGGDPNPIHHELSKLTNLTTLHILLPDAMFLPNEKICQKLLRYVIYISPDELSAKFYSKDEKRAFHLSKRALRLSKVAMQGRSLSLEILLESVEYMELERVNGFQTYFNNCNHGKAFANLTRLFIRNCDDLEHLSIPQNYQHLPRHQPMRSFSKLTELQIESSGFTYFLCPSSARSLVQLQKLSIRSCTMMEEIIRPREQELEEEEEIIEFPNLKDMDLRSLPRLKSFYCKKINTCSATPDQNTSTFPVHSLFNGMVSFPVLEELKIFDIENVIEIWDPQCHIKNSYSQLKILDVQHCDKLENVIPFAMLGRLQNMESLRVLDCISLKCIVNGAKTTMTEDQEGSDSEIIFPVLKTLTLVGLPKLDNFWCTRSMRSTIDQHQLSLLQKVSFPVLEELRMSSIKNVIEIWEPQCYIKNSFSQLKILDVHSCDKLENVIPFAMLGRLQNMETLQVQSCISLKCIVNGAKTARTEDQEGSNNEIVFPILKTLRLKKLPKLDNFWCTISMESTIDQHQLSLLQKVSFPVLEELRMSSIKNVIEIWEPQCHIKNSFSQLKILDVHSCDKLENVIPFAMLGRLQNMETLQVQSCISLKCIVNGAKTARTEDQEGSNNEIVFPILKTLRLKKLPKLDNFWCTRSMGSTIDQHQLSLLQKVSFPRLRNLEIDAKLIWEQIIFGDSAYQLRSLEISRQGKEEGGGELSKLTNLTTLHILLPDVMFLPYFIDISHDGLPSAKFYSEDKKRVLRISEVAMQGTSSSLEILLESVEYMELKSVNGFQTYFNNCNHGKAFANLTHLFIRNCDDLENLSILQNYQQLPHHQPMRSFSNLTELQIASSGFKYLFCPLSARRLGQLRKLYIFDCTMMEQIICPRKQEEVEEIIEFPNLKYMDLGSLPRLKSFYCKKINTCSATPDQNTSTLPAHSLFNGMVSFPVLEELKIFNIENVIEIWEPQCHIKNSFSQLKILDVDFCNKLENVIPFAMLGRLHNMESLRVHDCNSLKCIVNGAKTAMTEDQEGSDSEIVFPVLKTLELVGLPKLDNFWCTRSMGSTIDQHQPSLLQKVSFPMLENLEIRVKLNWEQISFGDSAYQLRSLEIFEIYPVFPPSCLERLQYLEELRVAHCGSNILRDLLCFRGLKKLLVGCCNLSTLFTCSLAKTNLQQLEVLSVSSCEKMEEIMSDENEGNKKMVATGTNAHAADEILIVFPRLKTIDLFHLPVLKSFCGSARYTFNMPSLEEVVLRNCPLMINFTCRQLTTSKFRITDGWYKKPKECTDLNKYLQTLLGAGAEGELEMANNSDGNQDNTEDDYNTEDDGEN